MIKFKPLPFLTIFTLPLCVFLFLLGNWQWSRYEYKKWLEKQPPKPIVSLETALKNPQEFQKVHINGNLSLPIIKIIASQEGFFGTRIFSAINTKEGNIIFEHGFVQDNELPQALDKAKSGMNINIVSIMRLSTKPKFGISENNIANGKFYTPIVKDMAKYLKVDLTNNQYYFTPIIAQPFGLKARQNPYADARGATFIEPARHLGYAITWWGLLFSLIVFYGALHIKKGRLGFYQKK